MVLVIIMEEKIEIKNECPHCGIETDEKGEVWYVKFTPRYSTAIYKETENPYANTLDCVRNLNERIEIIERCLDKHNFRD